MTTRTTLDRLKQARELIVRAAAVLAPVEIDEDADAAEAAAIAAAIAARSNLRGEEKRIGNAIGMHAGNHEPGTD